MRDASRFLYLWEAAQLGSMRAASEKLGIAASSISRQIANLESELGVELIERKRRSIKLTEAGELATKHYRESLGLKEAFTSEIEDLRGLRKGIVTIAMGEGYVGDALFDAIHEFSSHYPEIKLVVDVLATTDLINEAIFRDDAHIGLIFHTLADPRIQVQYDFSQPVMAIMAPTHSLAKKRSISMADLVQAPLALPRRQLRTRQLFDQAAAKENIWVSPALTTNSLLLLKQFAQKGNGVTVLPPLAASSELQAGSLCARKIRNVDLNETSALVIVRHGRKLPVAARAFLRNLASLSKTPLPQINKSAYQKE